MDSTMVAILSHSLEDMNHYSYGVVPVVCTYSIWKDFLQKIINFYSFLFIIRLFPYHTLLLGFEVFITLRSSLPV